VTTPLQPSHVARLCSSLALVLFRVDMETNVRTSNEFDFQKVLFCVNVSKAYF
jgi:hypothetical protein